MTLVKYDIDPVPAPRMVQSDRWKKRPVVLRYFAYKDEVRLRRVQLYESGSHITFVLPMPKTWSKKKKVAMLGMPHQQKPDWDNLAKGLFDAVYDEDSQVHDVRVSKIWGETGAILIEKE